MKIKELRTKKGISQAELGRFVGVERSTICQYEKGTRMPDNNTLIKLADYFGVSVDYLLERGYKITIPVEKWHKSLQQDYAKPVKKRKSVWNTNTAAWYLIVINLGLPLRSRKKNVRLG